MLALILGTIFSAGFAIVLRSAQGAKRNFWAVGVINYVVATAFQLYRYLTSGGGALAGPTIYLGIAAGTLYALNFWFTFRLMAFRGVSIANAMGRLSVMIPILAGVLIWHQSLGGIQGVGVALAVLALPLLTLQPKAVTSDVDPTMLRFSVAMFIGHGLSAAVIGAHSELVPDASAAGFLTVLFGSALCVATLAWWREGKEFTARDIPHGIALGLANTLANAGLVAALATLPGVIVFPFYSAMGVMLVAVVARIVWGESLGRLEMGGMAATLVAVVLMNLG